MLISLYKKIIIKEEKTELKLGFDKGLIINKKPIRFNHGMERSIETRFIKYI